jgi:urease accessory protein UreF
MPDDLFFLIVMSRWAIARAFFAASAMSARDKLATFLQASAVKIYRSTLRYGPLDSTAEQRFMERLDASLGFPIADTASLIESCRRFAGAVAPR